MVLGYHVIFGAYGFWLPNDPRGSWSEFVGSWELFRYGPATKTTETCSLASREHDHVQRLQAKQALKYPPVQFTGIQARAIGRGFAKYVERAGLTVWACAILPDHVHLVVGRFRLEIEQVVIQLKGRATQQLLVEGIHPFGNIRESNDRPPKCFARGEWKVFLDTVEDILRAIAYVEHNPIKEGKKPQPVALRGAVRPRGHRRPWLAATRSGAPRRV
jgi:REP element-mobilizing transposase RayT